MPDLPDQVLDSTGKSACPWTIEVIFLASGHSLIKSMPFTVFKMNFFPKFLVILCYTSFIFLLIPFSHRSENQVFYLLILFMMK